MATKVMEQIWNNWSCASNFFESAFQALYSKTLTEEELQELTKIVNETSVKVAEMNKVASKLALKVMMSPISAAKKA